MPSPCLFLLGSESTVARSGASHLVTIVDQGTPVRRPVDPGRSAPLPRLQRRDDAGGGISPAATISSGCSASWRGTGSGRSSSIACRHQPIDRRAFIGLCAIAPDRDEGEIAWDPALSPTAFPNPLMVALADGILGRNGRMSAAVAAIGRGVDAFESVPFVPPIRS
jgi:predicted protein tyrosine phosphatase